MMNIIKLLLMILLLNISNSSYSQNLSSSLKNEILEFLIKENEYTLKDLELLYQNLKEKNGVTFWTREEKIECNLDIKIYYFGSTYSHSRVYAVLIKENDEKIFLGKGITDEFNLLFNFVRFYSDENIICFYEKKFSSIIDNVYKNNSKIPSKFYNFFK